MVAILLTLGSAVEIEMVRTGCRALGRGKRTRVLFRFHFLLESLYTQQPSHLESILLIILLIILSNAMVVVYRTGIKPQKWQNRLIRMLV